LKAEALLMSFSIAGLHGGPWDESPWRLLINVFPLLLPFSTIVLQLSHSRRQLNHSAWKLYTFIF
jgi:hypothetical protein